MATNPLFKDVLILIKGAGDLASGVAYRLKRAGFPLIMTELPAPLFVRRAVCYGEAVFQGQVTVEGITAALVDSASEALALAGSDVIPVLVDPEGQSLSTVKPKVVVDAIMAKTNTGTRLTDAPFVVALGPGFTAGVDCHAVIETKRGHRLGRVITHGPAQANTGSPGKLKGHTLNRVLRAPAAGYVDSAAAIGAAIRQDQCIATVNGTEVRAPFDGVLRGLVHPTVSVTPGFKIGDLDPRGDIDHCFTISDKSLAVGGGVLEAILAHRLINSNAAGN